MPNTCHTLIFATGSMISSRQIKDHNFLPDFARQALSERLEVVYRVQDGERQGIIAPASGLHI